MPTYEYRCPSCDDTFELRRPMSESAASAVCPQGHPGARRLLSVFATTSGRQGSSVPSGEVAAAMGAPRGCGAACACH